MKREFHNALTLLSISLVAGAFPNAACRTPPPQKPEPELVTRRSEPFVPRIKRAEATAFEVGNELQDRVETAIKAEGESNEVVNVVGLDYGAERVLVVTHFRYPVAEMDEAATAAAVDEVAYERCQERFSSCVEGFDDCDDAGYNDCFRAAYRDPYLFAAGHLGVNCAVVEVSRYAAQEGDLRLLERATLEEMACDFVPAAYVPAAEDVDLDGGPELAIAYAFSNIELGEEGFINDVLHIIDAEDLHTQARLLIRTSLEHATERRVSNVIVDDRTGDGLPDLVVRDIVTLGDYCPDAGWTVSPSLMRPDPNEGEGACEMRVAADFIPYDPVHDVWGEREEEATP